MRSPTPLLLTLLLVVPLVGMPAAAAEATGGSIEDPEGDVSVQPCVVVSCGGFGTGASPYPDFIDLVRAGIVEETEDSVTLVMDFAGWQDPPNELLLKYPASFLWYSLNFGVNEDSYFGVSVFLQFALPPEEPTFSGYKWRYYSFGDAYEDAEMTPEEFTYSKSDSRITATLSKDWMKIGKSQRGIREGDELTWIWSMAQHGMFLGAAQLYSSDFAYGEPDYEFQFNAPNSVLALTFIDPYADEESDDESGPPATRAPVALGAGRTKAVPLAVTNGSPHKKLVNLTASVVGSEGNALAGWKAQAPPSVIVDAGQTLTLNVLLTSPAAAQHREGGILRVEGQFVGDPTLKGLAEREAYVAQGLTPAANQVFLHSFEDGPQFFEPLDPVFADALHFKRTVGSVLREDPLYADPTLDTIFGIFFGQMDTVEPSELILDLEQNGILSLNLYADRDRVVDVVLQLYAITPGGEDLFIGEVNEESVAVGTSAADHAFEFDLSGDAGTIPDGSRFGWDLFVEGCAAATPLGSVACGISPPGAKIDVTKSFIQLPVLEARTPSFKALSGEFLPTVSLAKGEGRDEFTNPGKAVAFNLSLVNGGTFDDVVDIVLNGSKAGWTARVVPASAYNLPPGKAVNFGVEVFAPAGAIEGDLFDLGIRAVSRNEPEAFSEVSVRVTVTTSIPIDSQTFTASSDSLNLTHTDKKKDTPGPGLVPALGALVLAVLAASAGRRRREA